MTERVFRAFHLAERLKLSALAKRFPETPVRASGTELVYAFPDGKYAIVYNFGAVVFFDLEPTRRERILTVLEQVLGPRDFRETSEEFSLAIGKEMFVDFGKVTLPNAGLAEISIISFALAQSTVLDYFEEVVDEVLQKSGHISENLESAGRAKKRTTDIIRFIGFCINTKQKVLTSTYLLDNPEPTWDDPLLEQLYVQMADQFELRDRFKTLSYKLQFVQDTLEIFTDISNTRRMLRLELAIVVLIAIEIMLFVYDLFGRSSLVEFFGG